MTRRRTRRQPNREITALLLLRRTDPTNPHQIGAGVIATNGYEYLDAGMWVIRGGRKAGKQECFILLINPDKTAILQSIKRGLDGGATTQNMLKAAFLLAQQKGATTIQLDDAAKKYISSTEYFYLSDMYFLTTGTTWYEAADVGIHPAAADAPIVDQWRAQRPGTPSGPLFVTNIPPRTYPLTSAI